MNKNGSTWTEIPPKLDKNESKENSLKTEDL